MLKKLWQHPGHLVWVLIAYLPFLNQMSVPLTGDQKLYLSIASEMQELGSWLKPMLWGEPSYFKPPFQYWMTLLGLEWGGFQLLSALLPSALATFLTAWFLGEIAYLIYGRRAFVNAGLWFAAALGTATFGSVAQMEIYVCLFYAASWWAGLKYLSQPRESRQDRYLYVAFAIAGLSSLIKSPLYSVFWVVGYFSYLLVRGEWELFWKKSLWRALALGILLGLAWFSIVLLQDGQRLWTEYFVRESAQKNHGNGGTISSLWIALLYFSFPFSLFLLPAFRTLWRARGTAPILQLLICWSWAPALFFSVFPYRIKPYLYILVPVLAVFVDWALFRSARSRFSRFFVRFSGIVVAIVFSFIAFVLYRGELTPVWITVGFAGVGIWAAVCAFQDWIRSFAICALMGVLLFRASAVSLGENDIQGLRAVVVEHPQAQLAMLDEGRDIWHERTLLGLALKQKIKRLDHIDQALALLHSGGVIILSDEQAQKWIRYLEVELSKKGSATGLREIPWSRWKRRTQFPFKELILHGRSGISDFEDRMRRQFRILVVSSH